MPMRNLLPSLLAGALMVLAGCATKPPRPAVTGDPIIDGKNQIVHGPARDRVLWQYRVATVAMRRGDYDEAKRQLDEAIARIGGIYTSSGDAKKARSYFHREAKKTFIGEPYERVMAYFYRGVLYWMDGEPDNARACFRSAQLQDADAENNEYAADWVLLDYMDGFATTKLGGEANDEFNRAVKNARGGSAPPAYHKNANVLLFIEFGKGPRKYATGAHKEQMRFSESQSRSRSVDVRLGTQQFSLIPYDDIQWQATTRGGREMDHILANKAVFKEATTTAAIAAAATSVALTGGPDRRGRPPVPNEAALVVGGIAVVAGVLAATTTPEADVRYWDSLPRYLTFAPLELPAGSHSITVQFRDQYGHTTQTKQVTVNVPAGAAKDTVLFISEHNT
jgi:hypothetical protein